MSVCVGGLFARVGRREECGLCTFTQVLFERREEKLVFGAFDFWLRLLDKVSRKNDVEYQNQIGSQEHEEERPDDHKPRDNHHPLHRPSAL